MHVVNASLKVSGGIYEPSSPLFILSAWFDTSVPFWGPMGVIFLTEEMHRCKAEAEKNFNCSPSTSITTGFLHSRVYWYHSSRREELLGRSCGSWCWSSYRGQYGCLLCCLFLWSGWSLTHFMINSQTQICCTWYLHTICLLGHVGHWEDIFLFITFQPIPAHFATPLPSQPFPFSKNPVRPIITVHLKCGNGLWNSLFFWLGVCLFSIVGTTLWKSSYNPPTSI